MKRLRKSGFEQDAFSRWGRKYLCYIQRPGVRKSAKRQANRRERREAKHDKG
jgi:hypothetical protein